MNIVVSFRRPDAGFHLELDRPRRQISLAGALDFASGLVLRDALTLLGASLGETVIVDLSQTTFIDSSGVNCLRAIRSWLDVAGARLDLRGMPERTRAVFDLCDAIAA